MASTGVFFGRFHIITLRDYFLSYHLYSAWNESLLNYSNYLVFFSKCNKVNSSLKNVLFKRLQVFKYMLLRGGVTSYLNGGF